MYIEISPRRTGKTHRLRLMNEVKYVAETYLCLLMN